MHLLDISPPAHHHQAQFGGAKLKVHSACEPTDSLLRFFAFPTRSHPTDRPPRAARRRKFWVGTTRPTDPPSGQGLFRPGRNDPTDRPTQRPGGSSDRVGRTRPTDPLNSGPATNSGLVRLRLRLGLSGAGSWGSTVRVKAKGTGLRVKGHRHLNTGRRRLDS